MTQCGFKYFKRMKSEQSMFFIAFVVVLSAIISGNVFSQGFYLGAGAVATFNNGANVRINGSLTIEDGAVLTQVGTGRIRITGDFIVNGSGSFVPGSGVIDFIGNLNSIIGGTASDPIDFYDIEINKDNSGVITYLEQNAELAHDLEILAGHFTYRGNNAYSLAVGNDIITSNNGTFEAQNAGAFVHTLSVGGDIFNNGVFNLNNSPNSVVNTTFTGAQPSLVTGNTPNFNFIEVNKNAYQYEVRINSAGLNAPSQFLTLTRGLFRISGTFAFTNTFFPVTLGEYVINNESGLWIENPNVTVTGQNASLTLGGILRNNGSYNIGNGAAARNLVYDNGATLIMDGGSLNIDSRLSRIDDDDEIFYAQYGGDVTVGRNFNSSADSRGMFDIGASSSTFICEGGNIEIQRQSNAAVKDGDYIVLADTGIVTGGKLTINDQNAAGQEYLINTKQPVGEFEMIARNNVRVRLTGNAATGFAVLGNITMAGNSGNYFNCTDYSSVSHDISIGGEWINNFGNATFFTAGGNTVTFNVAADQRIRGSQSTSFNNLTINQSVSGAKVLLNRETTANGNLRIISQTKLDLYGYEDRKSVV